MGEVTKARPGSGIWRRTDSDRISMRRQFSGQRWHDNDMGATDEDRLAAELEQPRAFWVFDSPRPADTEGFEVERILSEHPPVALASSCPPFGEWERLEEWHDDGVRGLFKG